MKTPARVKSALYQTKIHKLYGNLYFIIQLKYLFSRASNCCTSSENDAVGGKDDADVESGSDSEREAAELLLTQESEVLDSKEANSRNNARIQEPDKTKCFTIFCCCSKSTIDINSSDEQDEEKLEEGGEGLLFVDTERDVTKKSLINKVVGGEDLEKLNDVSETGEKKQPKNSTTMSNTEVRESFKSRTSTKIDYDKVI